MSEESVGDAGASSLGYFGGCFSPDGRSIVSHGFTGALHLWKREGMPPTMPQHHAWRQIGKWVLLAYLKNCTSISLSLGGAKRPCNTMAHLGRCL